ncbi:hypothetical protein EUGRSUZ_H01791 [Eucalyptus grandis]|uniref:Uncharacterized protein n=2 Tax=Eucalyptus grandis TaxID=71139 RepID=A0ACC3JRR6_EUCGR|nr:hypothetical protein EUGRSUZ_H01791 [Eucalyptus grandis]
MSYCSFFVWYFCLSSTALIMLNTCLTKFLNRRSMMVSGVWMIVVSCFTRKCFLLHVILVCSRFTHHRMSFRNC